MKFPCPWKKIGFTLYGNLLAIWAIPMRKFYVVIWLNVILKTGVNYLHSTKYRKEIYLMKIAFLQTACFYFKLTKFKVWDHKQQKVAELLFKLSNWIFPCQENLIRKKLFLKNSINSSLFLVSLAPYFDLWFQKIRVNYRINAKLFAIILQIL